MVLRTEIVVRLGRDKPALGEGGGLDHSTRVSECSIRFSVAVFYDRVFD